MASHRRSGAEASRPPPPPPATGRWKSDSIPSNSRSLPITWRANASRRKRASVSPNASQGQPKPRVRSLTTFDLCEWAIHRSRATPCCPTAPVPPEDLRRGTPTTRPCEARHSNGDVGLLAVNAQREVRSTRSASRRSGQRTGWSSAGQPRAIVDLSRNECTAPSLCSSLTVAASAERLR